MREWSIVTINDNPIPPIPIHSLRSAPVSFDQSQTYFSQLLFRALPVCTGPISVLLALTDWCNTKTLRLLAERRLLYVASCVCKFKCDCFHMINHKHCELNRINHQLWWTPISCRLTTEKTSTSWSVHDSQQGSTILKPRYQQPSLGVVGSELRPNGWLEPSSRRNTQNGRQDQVEYA